jgi:hemoglobin
MKKQIQSREDIEILVDAFYKKVLINPLIGHFFTEVAQIGLRQHMPVMYSFWETVLLGVMSFKGAPIPKHIELDRKMPLHKAHFDEWIRLWTETVYEHFEGEVADDAVKRANLMGELMLFKIGQGRQAGFVL